MKKVLTVLVVLSMVVGFASTSFAAWYVCDPIRLGAAGVDLNLVKVANCAPKAANNAWLEVVNQKDLTMATLLTAISLNSKVKLSVDLADGNTYPQIKTIYLDKSL